MRTIGGMDKRRYLETKIAQYEEQLQTLVSFGDDTFDNGTVIKFKFKFAEASENQVWYQYAMIKRKGLWYLTSGVNRNSSGFTWEQVIAFWDRGTVKKIRVARNFDELVPTLNGLQPRWDKDTDDTNQEG